MPVPRGMSGAPLVRRGGLQLTGILFGTNDVEVVDSSAGQRIQTTRVVSFGLAHTAATLRRVVGRATEGRALSDFLRK
jgi:hypothetical protein